MMNCRNNRSARAVNVALAALAVSHAPLLGAQARTIRADTLSARARDSIIAAVMADTLETVRRVAVRSPVSSQLIALRPTLRRFSVGGVNAQEAGMSTRFVSRFSRAVFRIDVTPISYIGDTSTTAGRPQVAFSGASPISGRLDLTLRSADTLRLFGQSASFPGALKPKDVQAVSAVGTSTIDLDAALLGAAARIGTRYTLSQALGTSGVAFSVRGGVEYDPKPSGDAVVSWRGTTVRGGLGVSRTGMRGTIGAAAEMTQSFADSLDGRNAFPGGGALTLDARALRTFGRDAGGLIALNGFYARPINLQRANVPTRINPVGDFMGGTVSAALPLFAVTVLPTVTALRESSRATSTSRGVTTTRNSSGQTASASLGLLVPLTRHITVTPEAGSTLGSVGQTTSERSALRTDRRTFSDPIRGKWFSLELSIAH